MRRSYIYPRTKRLITILSEEEQAAQQEHIEAIEQELAQLELFCLMNGLSLELFDEWRLSRNKG